MNKGKYTAIFIDLKKALDTADHDNLLAKLPKYAIAILEVTWLRSYLTDRNQFYKVNGVCLKTEGICCCVPQCSCLGPLLLLTFIYDLPMIFRSL